jgi:2,4-dienoyl-CoA reductase-like NADH-dependent reductase (Old Yellow Enzyme family)
VDTAPQISRDCPTAEAQKPSTIEDSLIEEKVPRKIDSASNSLSAAQGKEVIDELQKAKLLVNMQLQGSFVVQTNNSDTNQSPLANLSTDSESVKSTSSLNEATMNPITTKKVDSHLAAFAKHARKARDHKAQMEFLD